MRILLVLLMVSLFGVHAAVLPGAILSTTDTSGTNARPSRITVSPVSAGTNLMVGSLAVTNNLNVGADAAIVGSLGVTSSITNTALTPSTLVYSTATRVLGSLTLGNSGDVLTSAGAGVAPTFQPFPSFLTIWTNNNGTITTITNSPTYVSFAPGRILIGDASTGSGGADQNVVAIGSGSLANYTGNDPAIGIGVNTLNALVSGSQNVAIGEYSLSSISGESSWNTAVGASTLRNATGTSHDNNAFGEETLSALVTGNWNSGFGSSVLSSLTSGDDNMGFGESAFWRIETGSRNIGIGDNAGGNIVNGSDNIIIGNNGNPVAVGDLQNVIAIGSGVVIGADNDVVIGNSSSLVQINTGASDGTTPFFFSPSIIHTTGQLLTLTNGAFGFDISPTRGIALRDSAFNMSAQIEKGDAYLGHMSANGFINTNYIILDWGGGDFGEVAMAIYGDTDYFYWVRPQAPDGTTPYVNDTSIAHISGNLMEVKNNGTNKITGTWDGVVNVVGGFGSTATDAAVTIAATGWTNTFGKNAQVMMDGVALVYKVADAAGTFWYTNGTALSGAEFTLQTGGKFIITSGTLTIGRAKAW